MELDKVDLDMLGSALASQSYDLTWTFDPARGEPLCWIEGEEDEPDEDALIIEPLPSWVWYRDMTDFAARLSDRRLAERLERALQGKGAFRRFGDEIHDRGEHLISAWNAFRNTRSERRAVEWLRDHELITEEAADRHLDAHPDPDVP
jgi:uncharacterized protein UPF0158